jgi:hypothetical protein
MHRGTRRSLLALRDTTSRYHWNGDREDGFSEVRLVYDKEGHLVAVDYQLPAEDHPPEPRKQ